MLDQTTQSGNIVKEHLQKERQSFAELTALGLANNIGFFYSGPQSLLNKVLAGDCHRYASVAIALSDARESFRLALLPSLQEEADPQRRTRLGMLLMHLGYEEGTEVFLHALQDHELEVRSLALQEVNFLPMDILERKDKSSGVALLVRVVSALVPTLQIWQTECTGRTQIFTEGQGSFYESSRSATEPVFADSPNNFIVSRVVSFCVRHAFFECKPYLAPLRFHPDVGGLVIGAYAKHGCDEGTLDIIAEHLLRLVAGTATPQDGGMYPPLYKISDNLLAYAGPDTATEIRTRTVELVMQVLAETLASPATQERRPKEESDFRSVIESTLKILKLAKPKGAEAVLGRMLACEALSPVTRALALTGYQALTGVAPPERSNVVADLLKAIDEDRDSYTCVNMLRKLSPLHLLEHTDFTSVHKRAYWYADLVDGWSDYAPLSVAHDAPDVEQLRAALGDAVREPYIDAEGKHRLATWRIKPLVENLLVLCRTTEDDLFIAGHLRVALTVARRLNSDRQVIQQVMRHLLDFGDLASLVLDDMAPWDAMAAHWKVKGICWADAAQLLAQANVIDSMGPEHELAVASLDRERDKAVAFSYLLRLGGDRCTQESAKDQDHDGMVKTFENFVGLIRPAIKLDWVIGTRENSETIIQFCHARQGFRFSCGIVGRWVDYQPVLQGMNLFLERIGHPQRIYCTGERNERAEFIGACPTLFRSVRKKLLLPILDMAG